MEVTIENATVVPKESLSQIKFIDKEVLDNDQRKKLRNLYLKKAEILGNTYKSKVKLYFMTIQSEILAVETTVWFVNENHISLKGGISLPTNAIVAMDF